MRIDKDSLKALILNILKEDFHDENRGFSSYEKSLAVKYAAKKHRQNGLDLVVIKDNIENVYRVLDKKEFDKSPDWNDGDVVWSPEKGNTYKKKPVNEDADLTNQDYQTGYRKGFKEGRYQGYTEGHNAATKEHERRLKTVLAKAEHAKDTLEKAKEPQIPYLAHGKDFDKKLKAG